MTETSDPAATSPAPATAPTTGRDRVLLAVFWIWAAVLVVATLAQLFQWQGVLEVLDVKRWFSK